MTDSMGNRFGEIAVREGFSSRANVQACLEIQEKLRGYGVQPKRLGEIMVERGVLKADDVERVLALQANRGSRVESRTVRSSAETDDDDFTPPKSLAGYEIQELLGRGGMGSVYKARQTSLDRVVAIKILPPRTAKNRTFIQRFISEARTVARLNHKNIIAGIDVGEDKGFHYFVMEYVEGQSLDQVIARDGVLEESFALDVMVQMCRALEHAEKHKLVHRDVKPQNILIDKHGQAKLCDLGLAKSQDQGTDRNAPLGTPHYLSPEQAKGEALDIRSDLYSLGGTLFHMLVGRPPFEGQSPMVLMTKHLTETPELPRRLNSKISKGTSDLILALLEKDPDERPQSPTEVLDELDRIMTGKKPTFGSKVRPGPRRNEGSGESSTRKSKRSEANRTPAHDDVRRRRRAAAIRSVRKDENIFFLLFVGTVLAIAGLFVYYMFVRDNSVGNTDIVEISDDQESEALEALSEAIQYSTENRDDINGAREKFQAVISRYRGTKAADIARSKLNNLGS